jgi:hypothetical protein
LRRGVLDPLTNVGYDMDMWSVTVLPGGMSWCLRVSMQMGE